MNTDDQLTIAMCAYKAAIQSLTDDDLHLSAATKESIYKAVLAAVEYSAPISDEQGGAS